VKKSDLKKIIKPLVKECIHEVLLEEGLLSNVVSEVAKGLNSAPVIVEQAENPTKAPPRKKRDYSQNRKKLMDAIGAGSYNGVDLFEGTTPAPAEQSQAAGNVDLGDPDDAGVDIGSILGQSSKIWESMNKGKR
tara:strand:- start:248 stop:649 length:402 start_codon:yes stop_codon:yes gene_type:complete